MKNIIYTKYENDKITKYYRINKKDINDSYGLTVGEYIKELKEESINEIQENWLNNTPIRINIKNNYNNKEYEYMNLVEYNNIKKAGYIPSDDIWPYIF